MTALWTVTHGRPLPPRPVPALQVISSATHPPRGRSVTVMCDIGSLASASSSLDLGGAFCTVPAYYAMLCYAMSCYAMSR